ncbi:MAG: hypothetical protein Q8S17_01365 [Humidesulfovibrio sp.]|nr:hypothetical protein [Humidesulfovibrio sp.]
MRLRDFIKQTLLDITQGVEQAQGEASVWIAPGRVMGKEQLEPSFVSFETAVTISKDGAANIEIFSFGVEGSLSSEHVNKVSFKVPVYFNAPKDFEEKHKKL